MKINPLQIGFSIIIGWLIVFVGNSVIQPIIHPRGEEMFWGVLLLGLSLIGSIFIIKAKTISPDRAKTLLQIGVVVTIIWVMILIQSEGPYDLGLPKPYVTIGHTPEGYPLTTPLILIFLLGFPVLGLILLALGIVLNRLKPNQTQRMRDQLGRTIRARFSHTASLESIIVQFL